MPEVSQMLRMAARQSGVRLDIVEKDYALSYLLAAIAETPGQCETRGVAFTAPTDFLADALLDVAQREWDQQLLSFVPKAPTAEQVLAEVRPLILALWA